MDQKLKIFFEELGDVSDFSEEILVNLRDLLNDLVNASFEQARIDLKEVSKVAVCELRDIIQEQATEVILKRNCSGLIDVILQFSQEKIITTPVFRSDWITSATSLLSEGLKENLG